MDDFATVVEAYHTNADYEETNSPAKCRAFITACRRLLSPGVTPKKSVHGGRGAEEQEFDLMLLRDMLEAARTWLADYQANATGHDVVHFDSMNFRE